MTGIVISRRSPVVVGNTIEGASQRVSPSAARPARLSAATPSAGSATDVWLADERRLHRWAERHLPGRACRLSAGRLDCSQSCPGRHDRRPGLQRAEAGPRALPRLGAAPSSILGLSRGRDRCPARRGSQEGGGGLAGARHPGAGGSRGRRHRRQQRPGTGGDPRAGAARCARHHGRARPGQGRARPRRDPGGVPAAGLEVRQLDLSSLASVRTSAADAVRDHPASTSSSTMPGSWPRRLARPTTASSGRWVSTTSATSRSRRPSCRRSCDRAAARIVTVSSAVGLVGRPLREERLAPGPSYHAWLAYG